MLCGKVARGDSPGQIAMKDSVPNYVACKSEMSKTRLFSLEQQRRLRREKIEKKRIEGRQVKGNSLDPFIVL